MRWFVLCVVVIVLLCLGGALAIDDENDAHPWYWPYPVIVHHNDSPKRTVPKPATNNNKPAPKPPAPKAPPPRPPVKVGK